MAYLKLLLRCLLWAFVVVLVLAHIATFTVWQAYISGKTGAVDYLIPAVTLILAWAATYCLARTQRKILVWLWSGVVAILTAANGVLYQYYHSMHVPMSSHDIEPLLQLNWAELLCVQVSFCLGSTGSFIALAIIAVVLAATALLAYLLTPRTNAAYKTKSWTWGSLACALGCVIACAVLPNLQKVVRISSDWSQALAQAQSQFSSHSEISAHKQEQGELYILVIGESQNRDFMGIYNDLFATNPRLRASLDAARTVVFTNAYSCLTDTLPVLAHALSNQVVVNSQSTNLARIVGSDFVSLGAVLKSAQMHSVYLSNQNPRSLLGSDLTWLTTGFDETKFLNDSQWSRPKLDEELIPAFAQVLSSLDPKANNVVVLHLKGNQAPFAVRYPDSYAHYQPEQWNEGLVGSVVPDEAAALSFYLNATAYNDYVLAEIFAVAQQHPSFMGMLYFSDHSVALDDGHNYAAFDYEMTRIPLLFTCSERYAQRYGNKLTALRGNQDAFLLNDRIYDLFLDLMAVDSSAYQSEFSPANAAFKPLTDAALPEGVNLMSDPAYQVQQQWPKLPQALKAKLALHRSDSLLKFSYAYTLGLDRAEIDLSFDPKVGLCLNHDGCQVGDLNFTDFLKAHRAKLRYLWLDIKDLNAKNAPAIFDLLSSLDQSYDLKSIALVESMYPETLPQFIAAGWHTSYYLPWAELLNEESRAAYETQILSNIKSYGLTGVSYDCAAFELVNERISTGKWPQLKQYLWDLDIDLGRADIAAQVAKYEPVEVILVPLNTCFDY